jgi:uncharacterized protein with PIN domain
VNLTLLLTSSKNVYFNSSECMKLATQKVTSRSQQLLLSIASLCQATRTTNCTCAHCNTHVTPLLSEHFPWPSGKALAKFDNCPHCKHSFNEHSNDHMSWFRSGYIWKQAEWALGLLESQCFVNDHRVVYSSSYWKQ